LFISIGVPAGWRISTFLLAVVFLPIIAVIFGPMASKGIPYCFKEKSGSLLLIITLLWLTVSLPYISNASFSYGQIKPVSGQSAKTSNEKSTPISGNTEEKAASGGINSLSEEYLHHPEELVEVIVSAAGYNSIHLIGFYEAFHGEMLCPPPNS